MLSVSRDTLDSLSSLGEDWSRCGSAQFNAVLVPPCHLSLGGDMGVTTILSPPPVPRTPKPRKENHHLRLRSDSGLALHTNQTTLRQYTSNNSDESLQPLEPRPRPLSYDGSSNVSTLSLRKGSTESRELPRQSGPLPDFFEPEVVRMAFSNEITCQRLCRFAKSRHRATDMEFLMKVEEYARAFGNMTSLISQISTDFTGITATSPLGLPLDLSNVLKVSTRHCARSVLPPLERLYQDAKDSVEERLAKDLYPDFVKFQLTLCVRSSMSVNRSLAGGFKSAYPGLGDAFCLTDPNKYGNPIVFATDGLLRLSGYRRREMMGKNGRMLQCISTDTEVTQRIRESLALGRETVELVVNRRKDGTPFWNLLFICPLYEQGSVRYHLGAQINVSESMGIDFKDVLRILNFALPGEEFPPAVTSWLSTQERPVCRAPAPAKQGSVPPKTPQGLRNHQRCSYRRRFFRRFSSKSDSGGRPQSPRPTSPAVTPPTEDEDAPSAKRRSFTARNLQLERQSDEGSTPYSRFFVMRYTATAHHGHHAARMPIAFCSTFAVELLGIGGEHADAVRGLDILALLAECIGPPGINRGFKTTVLDRMAAGEGVSVDLMTSAELSWTSKGQAGKHFRNGSMMRAAPQVGGVGAVEADSAGRPRLSDTFNRGAEILSHVFFGCKMRRLVTHWAPLKDVDGRVAFVVLILTPTAMP